MRKIKTGVAFLLIYCTLIAAVPQSMAETPYTYEPEAWLLHRLGLYTGTSAEVFIPDLGAKLDRQIGVALLLNFFGKRVEVLNMSSTEADNVFRQPFNFTLGQAVYGLCGEERNRKGDIGVHPWAFGSIGWNRFCNDDPKTAGIWYGRQELSDVIENPF